MDRRIVIVVAVVGLVVGAQVNADVVFFDGFDGEYPANVWSMTLLQSGVGGTVSSVLKTDGGGSPRPLHVPPGIGANWLQTNNTINGSTEPKTAIGCFINSAAMYNPSIQGAIASIHYSEDQKMVSSTLPDGTSGQRASIVLRQGNKFYYSFGVTGRDLSWHEQLKDPIGSSSFAEINDLSSPGVFNPIPGSTPDFTATGGPIYFGFYRGNSDGAEGVGGYSQSMGIDNWHVLIRTVPEPATLALLSAGLVAALRARRRR